MGLEGQQLGHYRVRSLINRGGMGEIYLADDAHLPRQVAIKVVQGEPSAYPNPQALQETNRLFDREMRLISSLDHPSILQLLDYGNETIVGKPTTYMVMPYRPEGSLIDWLRRRGNTDPLPATDVVYLIRQAADALQHAHDRNILHMDVKPSNFLVRERRETPNRPDLLLADFGISKSAEGTKSTTARGTLAYMSAEQWHGTPSPASDQYSLAIMAYELLTGRVPFQGNEAQVMYQHMQVMPTPPSTVNPRVPHALDAVILRALAKNPQSRYPSVRAFADAFQQAASIPNNLTPPPPPPTPWPPQPIFPPTPQPPRRTNMTGRILLSVLAIIVVLGGGIYLLTALLPKPPGPIVQPTATPQPTPSPTPSTKLVLDNTMATSTGGWDVKGTFCSFDSTDNTYHIAQTQSGNLTRCLDRSATFNNFTYQLDINILSGDAGGVMFCSDNALLHYYYFRISTSGNYSLFLYNNGKYTTFISDKVSAAIKTGNNQMNVLKVVDASGSITLYINGTQVDTYNDSQLPSGEIGAIAEDFTSPTVASISNVKVWQ